MSIAQPTIKHRPGITYKKNLAEIEKIQKFLTCGSIDMGLGCPSAWNFELVPYPFIIRE